MTSSISPQITVPEGAPLGSGQQSCVPELHSPTAAGLQYAADAFDANRNSPASADNRITNLRMRPSSFSAESGKWALILRAQRPVFPFTRLSLIVASGSVSCHPPPDLANTAHPSIAETFATSAHRHAA
jgi:hypothetical protein